MEIDGLYDGEWNEGVPVPQNPSASGPGRTGAVNLCELVTTIDSRSADDLWKRFL